MNAQVGKPELNRILEYKNQAVIERFEDKLELTPSQAEELFKDVLTFLWLGVVSKEGLSPPPRIDDGWHDFLMFTVDYSAFCARFFGRMIHHRPFGRNSGPRLLNYEATVKVRSLLAVYAPTFAVSRNWDFYASSFLDQKRKDPKPSTNCSSDCTSCGSSHPHERPEPAQWCNSEIGERW